MATTNTNTAAAHAWIERFNSFADRIDFTDPIERARFREYIGLHVGATRHSIMRAVARELGCETVGRSREQTAALVALRMSWARRRQARARAAIDKTVRAAREANIALVNEHTHARRAAQKGHLPKRTADAMTDAKRCLERAVKLLELARDELDKT